MVKKLIFFVLLGVLLEYSAIKAATTHKHVHEVNKERVEDGVYSPRDAHHHEGGEHNTEFDHEAILGSVKEAEEFDTLPPEEAKRRLAILVKKMDLNKDQYVDRHELKAWILRSFKRLSEEEAAARFEEIDENQDEKVTWSEYLQDVYGMEDEDGNKDLSNTNINEEQKMIQDDKAMFHAADLNKDGLLNAEEFVLFQNPEEHPLMLPLILEQTLREKDTNKDGKIDFKEFIGEEAKDQDKEWLVTEMEKFENDFDKDKDGSLNGNEILSWVVPSSEEVATDEVNHLFAAADNDNDDRLSYEEIINNYDIFVGSEATDYGDHLHKISHFEDEL